MGTPMDEKPTKKNDAFSEYMWMGSIEEFDQEAEKAIAEELFIHSCIEKLLDEEEQDTVYFNGREKEPISASEPSPWSHQQQEPSYDLASQSSSNSSSLNQAMSQCAIGQGYRDDSSRYPNNYYSVNHNGTHFYSYDDNNQRQGESQGHPQYANGAVGNGIDSSARSHGKQTTNVLNPDAQEFVPGKPFDWSKFRQQSPGYYGGMNTH